MRRVAIVTAVVSLVLATVTAAGAVHGTAPQEADGPPLPPDDLVVDAPAAPDTTPAEQAGGPAAPAEDRARGLVFDGLRPAGPDANCPNGFAVAVPRGTVCTHGPDAAPAGVDVRAPRSIADLRRDTVSPAAETGRHVHADGTVHDHGIAADTGGDSTASATGGSVPVVDDGVSGNRVLAIYAVASDRPDRYTEVAPLIADWAAHVDDMVNGSAALTGGERHVRFVTDAAGALVVDKVVLAPSGDDTFANLISALQSAGYTDPARKYLVWTDASLYCGIATIYQDDRPGQENLNNGQAAQYGRIDTACWGHSSSTELHELVHMLGGVQPSAPSGTSGFHCTDEYDRMCFLESAGAPTNCDLAMDAYLDCGHDDYFHTSPPAGSYLANHWNVADSSFLHAGPVGGDPPPPPPTVNTAPVVTASGPGSVVLSDGAALDGTVADDGLPGPYTVAWSQASGPGTVTFADAGAEDTTASFSAPGTYVVTLTADDGELTGADSLTITVDADPPPPPATTTEVFEGSLNKKWPARSFVTTVSDGQADAVLTFGGGRGKKAAQQQLTLNAYDSAGALIGTATGTSPVTLSVALTAGSYTWEVTGGRTSFSLEVTYFAP